MYELDIENRFHRAYAIVTDAHGIDPLLDKVTPRIAAIDLYKNHEVVQDERGSPDLISLREYGTEDFWWHIMTYNGICRFRDIVEGLTLKIPELGSIVSVTNDATTDVSPTGENITTI
jgi:hypothetical protein